MASEITVEKHKSEMWKDAIAKEAYDSLMEEMQKLLNPLTADERNKWENEFERFKGLFHQFLTKETQVTWEKVKAPPENLIQSYNSLKEPDDSQIKMLLNKLVVAKLNGGLGTSMGCQGPKSAIPVRNDLTFLDITMQLMEQINKKYDVDIPLILMNSFNTDADTKKILRKYRNVRVTVFTFNQSRYPRIDKEMLLPICPNLTMYNNEHWYPPGHGDFYAAFTESGLLGKFLDMGKEFCFISNIDNLCASVDLKILNFIAQSGVEYLMEVIDKTRSDVKGSTLIFYEGKARLLEMAQVPKENQDDFKDTSKFKTFNTNNIWCNLKATQHLVTSGQMDLDLVVNHKFLEEFGENIIQLETSIGAAMKNFRTAAYVNVPRSRFLPVKFTQDLLLVSSNLYNLKDGMLSFSPLRKIPSLPLIRLGSCFTKVNEFLRRFRGIPDVLELEQLTVSGDVTFEKNVRLKGSVIIIANHGECINIPQCAVLENVIVSGNLRILYN